MYVDGVMRGKIRQGKMVIKRQNINRIISKGLNNLDMNQDKVKEICKIKD